MNIATHHADIFPKYPGRFSCSDLAKMLVVGQLSIREGGILDTAVSQISYQRRHVSNWYYQYLFNRDWNNLQFVKKYLYSSHIALEGIISLEPPSLNIVDYKTDIMHTLVQSFPQSES